MLALADLTTALILLKVFFPAAGQLFLAFSSSCSSLPPPRSLPWFSIFGSTTCGGGTRHNRLTIVVDYKATLAVIKGKFKKQNESALKGFFYNMLPETTSKAKLADDDESRTVAINDTYPLITRISSCVALLFFSVSATILTQLSKTKEGKIRIQHLRHSSIRGSHQAYGVCTQPVLHKPSSWQLDEVLLVILRVIRDSRVLLFRQQ